MTKEEDICKEVVAVLQKIGGFIKLSSVATDGASSMTGKTLGLVGLLQKHGIKCPFIYCIIHQESLCVNQLKWKDAMKMVAKIMNAVSGRNYRYSLLHGRLNCFLAELHVAYGDLLLHSNSKQDSIRARQDDLMKAMP